MYFTIFILGTAISGTLASSRPRDFLPRYFFISVSEWFGELGIFCWQLLRAALTPPYEFREFFRQCDEIGSKSLPLVALAGAATGAGSDARCLLDSHASGEQVLDEGPQPERRQWRILRRRPSHGGCRRRGQFGRELGELQKSMGVFARLSSGAVGDGAGIAYCRRCGARKGLSASRRETTCA